MVIVPDVELKSYERAGVPDSWESFAWTWTEFDRREGSSYRAAERHAQVEVARRRRSWLFAFLMWTLGPPFTHETTVRNALLGSQHLFVQFMDGASVRVPRCAIWGRATVRGAPRLQLFQVGNTRHIYFPGPVCPVVQSLNWQLGCDVEGR